MSHSKSKQAVGTNIFTLNIYNILFKGATIHVEVCFYSEVKVVDEYADVYFTHTIDELRYNDQNRENR